jgi:hypothetical protein
MLSGSLVPDPPFESRDAMSGFIAMLVLTVILVVLFAFVARAMFGD